MERKLSIPAVVAILLLVTLFILTVWIGPTYFKVSKEHPDISVSEKIKLATIEPSPQEAAIMQAQSEELWCQKWANSAKPQETGGIYEGTYFPGNPAGQVWIPDVRFSFTSAVVYIDGTRIEKAQVMFEPPGTAGGHGVTIIRLTDEQDKILGLGQGATKVKIFPIK